MSQARILVVEDERIIGLGIRKRLTALGYQVVGLAGEGAEGVQMALEFDPDLVLMDIDLGVGIDGIEAAQRIRADRDIPVVFLTAYSDDSTLRRATLSDPFGYVLKPYEDRDLQTAIEIGLYRHRMDRQLRQNEQWLAATLASIGDGVIATDENGDIRLMNDLARQLTGWSEGEAMGHPIEEVFRIINSRTREEVENPIRKALQTGEPALLAPDTLLRERNGSEIPVDDSASPIVDADGRTVGAVLVFRDITAQLRMQDHLRQSQRLEALGRLAGGVAHDFNNILTIILGLTDMLQAYEMGASDTREAHREIHDAARRAAVLTRQILAFGRRQIMAPKIIDLNEAVEEAGSLVRRLVGSNIIVDVELGTGIPPVRVDEGQLGQVLLNLGANARDAMPDGGRLVIQTRACEIRADEHPGVEAGPYAAIDVEDNGIGIPPHVLEHVFDPFFTTKEMGEGTGLGLATVYGIVKQSEGHILIDSAPREGTRVTVLIPASAPGVADDGDVPEGLRLLTGNETLLVVEDQPAIRSMLRRVLVRAGYQVLVAEDGAAGLKAATDHPDVIDLLVTDMVMPHVSGREIADQLIASGKVKRVLFISGHSDDVITRQGIEAGQADFIQKPFELVAFARKVRELLETPTPDD